MAAKKLTNFPSILLIFMLILPIEAWDSNELELFDLIEEINKNFYEVMGVEQGVSIGELKKAYRRLSLLIHPDKNKEPDAEEKFRQLVAIYEVLKDDGKRQLYDNVLQNGLPTWHQPIYYYRRVRKMSLLELVILLFILTTGGQYILAWSMYIERKYELEEVLLSKFKKKMEKKRKSNKTNDCKDLMMDELDRLPKPRCQDLLPFQMVYFLVYVFKSLPSCYQKLREIRIKQEEEEEEFNAESDEQVVRVRKPHRKPFFQFPDLNSGCVLESVEEPEARDERKFMEVLNNNEDQFETDYGKKKSSRKHGEWTEEELIALTKAINKFPGGVPGRWEKIADAVDRTVSEVLVMSKKLKSSTLNAGLGFSSAVQGITGSVEVDVVQSTSKHSLANGGDTWDGSLDTSVKTQKANVLHRNVQTIRDEPVVLAENESSQNEDAMWSQPQQKALELALVQFPKGVDQRWERIAECVSEKSKEECIGRYKLLAELVKRKRQMNVKTC